jgi:hypothetical protein
MVGEKIKIAVKNQDGVMWTIFSTKIILKLQLAALLETFFDANLFVSKKRSFEILKFGKMAT